VTPNCRQLWPHFAPVCKPGSIQLNWRGACPTATPGAAHDCAGAVPVFAPPITGAITRPPAQWWAGTAPARFKTGFVLLYHFGGWPDRVKPSTEATLTPRFSGGSMATRPKDNFTSDTASRAKPPPILHPVHQQNYLHCDLNSTKTLLGPSAANGC